MGFQFLYRKNEMIDEWKVNAEELPFHLEFISEKETIETAIEDFEENVFDIWDLDYEVRDPNGEMININDTKLSCYI